MSEWWEDRRDQWQLVLKAFAGKNLTKNEWYRVACPACELEGKRDTKLSLGFNPVLGGYRCFKCDLHGSIPSSYLDELGEDGLSGRIFADVSKSEAPAAIAEECVGFTPVFEEPGRSSLIFGFARDYLLGRGLSEQACFEARVGATLEGRMAGRVVVPIPDYSNPAGPWRGWVAREALGRSGKPPYLYAKGMNRAGLLYNALALQIKTDRPCYVVEGTLDALALWPDAVAVLGKPLESQMAALVASRRPVVIAFDGDAWRIGWALAVRLRHLGVRAANIRLAPRVDPDEVPREWLDRAAREALGS